MFSIDLNDQRIAMIAPMQEFTSLYRMEKGTTLTVD
jgi:hypothetical protein